MFFWRVLAHLKLSATVIAALFALPVTERGDHKLVAVAVSELQQIRPLTAKAKAAEENIEKIIRAAKMTALLSFDAGADNVRLQLAELLKIWQRKWYLLAKGERTEDEKDERD